MIRGRVWKFKDDVDTDQIIPARYLVTTDPKELAKHVMEDADPTFPSKVKEGDILVAGKNFGCGSSREHAPLAIKGAGIAAVVAESFARIFFRNAINLGLLIIESPEAAREAEEGDILEIDINQGVIRNVTKNKEYKIKPLPENLQAILKAGGLMEYAKEKIKNAS
ncbi:MAG TPA: 3-isopropylmalate dehydratase small subunit [Sulfurihydrogenibium sp.]|jgi:3-isopropylmalate/(R)-2-methylmalate dehydratase small subunit|uniref:3-isopropylmalate dehydratase small subunit n=2 Tax=Hydrogenothermaceae TaxID=224027 RepID=C4FLQ4_9AQUI|nr:3-isopropylmalate dehydratase, small subunit [Sulfurihydrogenibium sp. YO3AOP1]EEP59998.1 3-isopropylmalate dehydratase, small subunit [Sulfurihydrogenibium yellowstonense SS-5]MBX0312416.1 3-isopropylmalate dehydratase small subunit [Sulfurihydrogenibium sp.]HBT98798.1 3-isopropylmalate dehydratase small subunit [Sulfurihydrogenibium sp.]